MQIPSAIETSAPASRWRWATKEIVWHPQGKQSSLRYEFTVNHQRSSGSYDSYITQDWALFRGDKLTPSTRVTAARNLRSHTTLEFNLPKGWSGRDALCHRSGGTAVDDPKAALR